MSRLALLALAVALAGCGHKGPISRIDPAGKTRAELREARAAEQQALKAALAPRAEHRPIRVDDLTIRLEDRADDPFSLPPE
jgi:predicted small lipoprotein YifL